MEAILDGLKLMVAGMGTVFIFLLVMILWIVFAAKVTARFAHLLPETAVKPPPSGKPTPSTQGTTEDENIIAAIIGAVHRYRAERKK